MTPIRLPTKPLLLRVDYPCRHAFFDRAPNRLIRRHWKRSTVYLPLERRERRYVLATRRVMREAGFLDEWFDDERTWRP